VKFASLVAAVILALALGIAQAAEWVLEGRVVAVSDGDTITVLDDAKTEAVCDGVLSF
jgi:hypothetical protein